MRGDSIFSIRAKAIVRSRRNGAPATDSSRLRLRYKRAQLGEREAGLEPFEHLALEPPAHAPVGVLLVVEREAGFLQRRQIAPDRPRRHAEFVGQRVDRHAVPRGLERVQHLPLADDFLVAGHGV